jgi:hypothetical protein
VGGRDGRDIGRFVCVCARASDGDELGGKALREGGREGGRKRGKMSE